MITFNLPNGLNFNLKTQRFLTSASNLDILKYLKGIYTNRARFESKFITKLKSRSLHSVCDFLLTNYDNTEPFTYTEAFKIENDEFRVLVFGSIDIVEMVENLGHERIATEGKEVKRKVFAKDGSFIEFKEYTNIYETHKIFGEKLGLEEDLFAVKCWCTSTDKEHWIWIEDEYKDKPLDAIASTFRIHKNLIPHIKELKRQGDIMLVELNKEVTPSGDVVPLTNEQYFTLLTSES